MSCKCQECGCQYKVDLIISNSLWNQIKPFGKEDGQGLLCGSCIMYKVEKLGEYGAIICTEEQLNTLTRPAVIEAVAKELKNALIINTKTARLYSRRFIQVAIEAAGKDQTESSLARFRREHVSKVEIKKEKEPKP